MAVIKRVNICAAMPMYELLKNAMAEAALWVNLKIANAAADLSE
jgi:hypothetical protein